MLVIAMLAVSCVADNPDREPDAGTPPPPAGEVWICHNPETRFHDELCVEDYYPEGCYVKGNAHTYCWLLEPEDCAPDAGTAPWKKHCPEL